jgi:cytochrome c-type biogenesis protein CcmH/NrfF
VEVTVAETSPIASRRSFVRSGVATVVTIVLAAIVVAGIASGPAQPGNRVDSLAAVIRCPQCHGESIKDSSAPTARTMRLIVAERVDAGQTDKEILDYFRGLYGNQAILDPGLSASTIALWAIPALTLAAGIGMMRWLVRSRNS